MSMDLPGQSSTAYSIMGRRSGRSGGLGGSEHPQVHERELSLWPHQPGDAEAVERCLLVVAESCLGLSHHLGVGDVLCRLAAPCPRVVRLGGVACSCRVGVAAAQLLADLCALFVQLGGREGRELTFQAVQLEVEQGQLGDGVTVVHVCFPLGGGLVQPVQ